MAEQHAPRHPLEVFLCVDREVWDRDRTDIHLTLRVRHGPLECSHREVLAASIMVPLFDVVMDRLKEEIRRRWLLTESPEGGRDYGRQA